MDTIPSIAGVRKPLLSGPSVVAVSVEVGTSEVVDVLPILVEDFTVEVELREYGADDKDEEILEEELEICKVEDCEVEVGEVEDCESEVGEVEDCEVEVEDCEAEVGDVEDCESEMGEVEDCEVEENELWVARLEVVNS